MPLGKQCWYFFYAQLLIHTSLQMDNVFYII